MAKLSLINRDIKRAKRGAWPGPAIEPDATTRANLAQLGRYGVRYGAMGQETQPPPVGGGTAGQPVGGLFLTITKAS